MHALEIIDGQASAAFVVTGEDGRTEPWHHLGVYVNEAMTAEEALTLARLDWEARLVSVRTMTGTKIDGRKAVVRDNAEGKEDVLGVVGMKWRPVQNREAFAFCDDLVQAAGDAHYETAGMLRPLYGSGMLGAQTFMTLRRPDLFLDPNGRNDAISRYLLCANGFDGRRAFTLKITNVRVVCKNTEEMALAGAGDSWKVNHTASVKGRMAEAQKALGLVTDFDTLMVEACEAMIQREITDRQFHSLVADVFPKPDDDAGDVTKRRYSETVERLDALYRGTRNENITGTAWGAYNAVTEFLDWERPGRAKDVEKRATQTLLSPHLARTKREAFDRALALV